MISNDIQIGSRLEKRVENLENKLEKTNKVVRNQALEVNKPEKGSGST